MNYDVVIIGGSYAGMSAGMQLARARRSVLVVDAGQRRNRYATASHGFLTRDGSPPDVLAAEGRAQLLAYPTVEWLDAQAQRVEKTEDGFLVSMDGASSVRGQRIILAIGITDHLPDLPGLKERWGRTVFHCPYCHGYELQQGRIGVLASSALSMHHALMLPDWGKTTFFLNGSFAPDSEQQAALQARGVHIEDGPIERLSGEHLDVVMKDGRIIPLDGLFTTTRTTPGSPIAAQLGCEFEEMPMGMQIRTDSTQASSVPGVFACGDAARLAGNVALAVGDGAMAGTAAHRSLMFGL
ncbi:NAD(P)/FAD-dependent oxidoreductase [Pollutimonas sp. M17]|uniref:NAD(P)/FAD-dependent oxidoreductase n=1 Tax=Pollutimonas sp. M17 TaxID=2962065 RepID=UPI0021F42291|nr:NAD(P)/FAD-dependent oxidoreductase [Pollutimonas sp. M17]UYO93335.1 NAD(P)/FAD-dependent oxidoreductase [Pollutimonas sp. M17]